MKRTKHGFKRLDDKPSKSKQLHNPTEQELASMFAGTELYTATLMLNKCRKMGIYRKILLNSIYDSSGTEFRNHCWVDEEEVLAKVPQWMLDKCRGNKEDGSATIKFRATPKQYQTIGPAKMSFVNVNIESIKYNKFRIK